MKQVVKGSFSSPAADSRGNALYAAGRFKDAADYYLGEVEKKKKADKQPRVSDLIGLAKSYYALQDYRTSIGFVQQAIAIKSDNRALKRYLAVCHSLAGGYAEAVDIYEQLLDDGEDDWVVLDGLAHCYHNLKQKDKSIFYGRKSLEAKDALVFSKRNPAFDVVSKKSYNPSKEPVLSFQTQNPERNVISYSLWGSRKFYLEGAVENARLARVIYPDWKCRFYCDSSVPEAVIGELKRYGAKVVMMPPFSRAYEGLFWRFQVVNDPSVDRYLIRDADSPLTCQERVAVDEWIASGKRFHVIRDWYTHSELILAGLFGGVKGALPDLKPLIDSFYEKVEIERTIDQRFLRWYVWPVAREDHLAHDEYFSFGNATGFPAIGKNGPGIHIGANWNVFAGKQGQKVSAGSPGKKIKKR